MNNYERLCSGVAEMADFLLRHTTCFVCPVGCCRGFHGFEGCEDAVIEWLLKDESEDEE
jgi:hypothetical protein